MLRKVYLRASKARYSSCYLGHCSGRYSGRYENLTIGIAVITEQIEYRIEVIFGGGQLIVSIGSGISLDLQCSAGFARLVAINPQ